MSQSIVTPQKKDWNHFWEHYQAASPHQLSWSKKRIIQVIHPYVAAGKKALDAGCGSGFFAKYFCEQGMETTAVDYSDTALARTEHLTAGRARLCPCDLLNDFLLNKLKNKFDLIFTDGLFEHFSSEKQDKIMQNIISVLGEEGVVITFVPNRWSPWEIIRPFYMPGIQETPFILEGLLDLNERNRLTVIKSGGINTLPLAFSPEGQLAKYFGMLLYAIALKNE